MRRRSEQSGMSLAEVLVALAVILVLISAMMGVGSYVKTRADIDLTDGMLEVLCTALTQYYDDAGHFPFVTDKDYDSDSVIDIPYDKLHLEYDISQFSGVAAVVNVSDLLEQDGNGNPVSGASSAALFYFLDKNPVSRGIASAVVNSLITNEDGSGMAIMIEMPPTSGNLVDLPRYIDPWKMSIRYQYLPGTAFPALTSAGPDRTFDTPDDITSK